MAIDDLDSSLPQKSAIVRMVVVGYPWNYRTSRDVESKLKNWDSASCTLITLFKKVQKYRHSLWSRLSQSEHSAQRNDFTDKLLLRSLKVGKKNDIFQITKYCNPLGLLKNQTIFRPTLNAIVLKIENNGPVLPFPFFLQNSQKPTKPYKTCNC